MSEQFMLGRRAVLGGIMLAPLANRVLAQGAASAKQPNFLFVFPDQHRYDWLSGAADLPVNTPNIDKLAARGVRFAKAYCSSPVCAPSRACLLSGREFDDSGVDGNWADYPSAQGGYFTGLRNAGYHVAACGKLDLSKGSGTIGLDGRDHMEEWGVSDMINCGGKGDAVNKWKRKHSPQEPYMAYLQDEGLAEEHADDILGRGGFNGDRVEEYSATYPTPLNDEHYQDNFIGRTALTLMDRFPQGKPWHLVINFAGPHDPLDITGAMEKTVRGRDFRQPIANDQLPPETHVAIRENYTAMVENLDRWVGVLVEQLEKRGELDNTVIVFSSDHGEMLGDHNLWAKNYPYEASACVPMVVAGPGVQHRAGSDALVSLIDVGATFIDYAGAERPEGMVAQSLRPVLEGKSDKHRDYAYSGLGQWRMVTDGRWKLITGYDPKAGAYIGTEPVDAKPPAILFDLQEDPDELANVAEAQPEVVARLQAAMLPRNPDPKYGRFPEERMRMREERARRAKDSAGAKNAQPAD